MVTFFVILFVLVVVNAALLVDSSISARNRATGATPSIPDQPEIKIYPIDLQNSSYKKAI